MLRKILASFRTLFKTDLILPLLLLLVYIIFFLIVRGTIPTAEELITSFSKFYERYGYQIIFIAAFLEASVLINIFVPGSVAMAMGAIFSRTGQVELTLVIITASVGALIGYMLDFVLGYFGFSDILERLGYKKLIAPLQTQLLKLGTKGLILGLINPTIGSYLSLAAGTARTSYGLFLLIATVSTFVWMSLWGLLFYLLGGILLQVFIKFSFLLLLLVISIMFLGKLWSKEKI